MSEEKRGSLPVKLMQDIVNYLEEKPFKEVANLLVGPDGVAKNFQPIPENLDVAPDSKSKEEQANGEIRANAE